MDPSSITTTHVPAYQHSALDTTGPADVDTQTLTTEVDGNFHKGPVLSEEVTYTAFSPSSTENIGRGSMSQKEFVKSTENPSMEQHMIAMFVQVHDADPPIATEQ